VGNLAGRLIGYNTDGAGFIASLKEDAGIDPAGKTAVILGAGGASRAVSTMLLEAGAKLVFVSDVEAEKARALSTDLLKLFPSQCQFLALDSQAVQKALENSDLLINASPVGMHPHTTNSPLPEGITPPSSLFVYDLVYNPRETALLQKAKSAGCKTCGGLGMLVQQGALAFTLWTGLPAPVAVMRQAAEEALSLS
jgi:shikimate dehydrogenase